jgi:hypothetical protein
MRSGWIMAAATIALGLACTGAGTDADVPAVPGAQPAPAPSPPPADEDPAKFVGKWFYLKHIADSCLTGKWDDEPLLVGATEFRGPGKLVEIDAANPEQVLEIVSTERRGEDWILKVRTEGYEGERLLRWTRYGEEMVFGMPEDGGLPYVRLDHPVDVVDRALSAGTRCGDPAEPAPDRAKGKGKAGKGAKHKAG